MDQGGGGGHDFERLYRDAGPTLWRALFAFTGGREDLASDALDEAFARALEHGGRIRRPEAWLYRVAFRVALEELRRERRGHSEHEADPASEDALELEDVMAAIRKLSPNQRAAVFL